MGRIAFSKWISCVGPQPANFRRFLENERIARDRANRLHGFRKIARAVVAQLNPEQRAILDAYTAGVNAGLTALAERPFEYLVLRDRPEPWLPEDSILVIFAMTIDPPG
jgi:penicillin amidase